ncbi:ABC transporter substrate-binding protein [Marinobacter sp. CHS3-4]|uniref:ABC transporter substrate-binding protein n=1 Tax=Marinobacter sp. CHS3-4 TaxID=3045174 RepID=UPI0024B5853D|nr:ABC transporter substrate-binding protein [Marinobacter sp. CHS3-4]MDI9245305.1 ABC transporter substrate-binding protein [Marinobacter sp. CHS3-4]
MNINHSNTIRQQLLANLTKVTGPILLAVFALFQAGLSLAGSDPPIPSSIVYVAESQNDNLNRRITELLIEAFPESVALRSFTPGQTSQDNTSPVIALGPDAFNQVRRENARVPVLGLFADKAFLESDIEQGPGQNVSAILSDTPLIRQAAIGKSILPYATRVAMLARPETEDLYVPVLEQLQSLGMEGRIFVVPSTERLIPTLIRALDYGDFLLAATGDGVYNPRTIKHILLTAYRRNIIVIGPSQPYVKAGALASSFTPLSEIAESATEYLQHYWQTGEFPPAKRPEAFGIEINRQVGRSLNIPIPERQALIDSVIQRLQNRGAQSNE